MQRFQTAALVALRMIIGWHFLYEGLAKLTNPYWTSAGYLAGSKGILGEQFVRLAASPTAVTVIDAMNEWGLTLIGLGLLLGLLARPAALAGVAVLALYYIAAPPFPGLEYAMPAEGAYLVVNKVLVELVALLVVVAFPTSRRWGLDRLVFGPGDESDPGTEPGAPPRAAPAQTPAATPSEPTQEVHS